MPQRNWLPLIILIVALIGAAAGAFVYLETPKSSDTSALMQTIARVCPVALVLIVLWAMRRRA